MTVLYERATALFKKAGDLWLYGEMHLGLADVYLAQGEERRGLALLDERLAIHAQSGNSWATGWFLGLFSHHLWVALHHKEAVSTIFTFVLPSLPAIFTFVLPSCSILLLSFDFVFWIRGALCLSKLFSTLLLSSVKLTARNAFTLSPFNQQN